MMSEPNLPTPEQLQQRLQEFLRASFAAPAQASPAENAEEPATGQKAHPVFEFKLTPRDIKRHLDRFVIQQDEAKKALSIAVCDQRRVLTGGVERDTVGRLRTERRVAGHTKDAKITR